MARKVHHWLQRFTNNEVSARWFVVADTVEVHLHDVFDKLQVRRWQDMADYACKKGLV
jgi:DNA-binding NarL/FixJ family response regulator